MPPFDNVQGPYTPAEQGLFDTARGVSNGSMSMFDPMEMMKQMLLQQGTARMDQALAAQVAQRQRLTLRGPAEGVSEREGYQAKDTAEVEDFRNRRLADTNQDWTREDMQNEATSSVYNDHMAPHSFAGLAPHEITGAVAHAQRKEEAYQRQQREAAQLADVNARLDAGRRKLAAANGTPDATYLSGDPDTMGYLPQADKDYRGLPLDTQPQPDLQTYLANLDEESAIDRLKAQTQFPVY